LSYGFWQRRFGNDGSAIGKSLLVEGRPREIIGVLPRDFWFNDLKPAILLPARLNRSKTFLGNFTYKSIARLKNGISLAEANADIDRMIPIALRDTPPAPGYSGDTFYEAGLAADLHLLKDYVTGDVAAVLWVVMGTIGMVFLIAGANVANQLLV